MDTAIFQTRTDIRNLHNPKINGAFILGLDLGYSSIKGFAPNTVYCIPSFSKEIKGEFVGSLSDKEIIYINEQSRQFYIGELAQKTVKRGENITETSIYGRNHYLSPEFLIQFRIGLAMALWNETVDSKEIFIQTGLPPAYLTEDEPYLRSVFEGHHTFRVIKGKETRDFEITIDSKQIDVMIQPMGTLFSICTDSNGNLTSDLNTYYNSNTLILDGGFVTLDKYLIEDRSVIAKDTDSNLGMKRVLEETRNKLLADNPNLRTAISIPEIQGYLRTGKFIYRDKVRMEEKEIDISRYFTEANEMVCKEAFESVHDVIYDLDNLIMTGGTGAAWNNYFVNQLRAFPSIKVIPGNSQSDLPYIYANARGYYMKALNTFKRNNR